MGQHTLPPSAIDAYEVRVRLLGFSGRGPFVAWGLFALLGIGFVVALCRVAWGVFTGVSEPENVYAQDLFDFLLPVASFPTVLFLLFVFRGARMSVVLRLKPGPASAGSTVMWIAPKATKDAAGRVAILVDALHRVAPHARMIPRGKPVEFPDSSEPQNALYWDGTTAVTTDYVIYKRYKHQRLPVADITQVSITVPVVYSYIWVLHAFNSLVLSALSGMQLIANPPVIQNGVALLPRLWLWALATLILMPVLFASWIEGFRNRNANKLYTVMVHGRFGRSNSDVILPIEILSTASEEHAKKVGSAIQQAVGWRAEFYASSGKNTVPGLGQSNA